VATEAMPKYFSANLEYGPGFVVVRTDSRVTSNPVLGKVYMKPFGERIDASFTGLITVVFLVQPTKSTAEIMKK
jgi:hypothetical protein